MILTKASFVGFVSQISGKRLCVFALLASLVVFFFSAQPGTDGETHLSHQGWCGLWCG